MLYDTRRIMQGYPMYQTVKKDKEKKISVITMVSDKPLVVDDEIAINEKDGLFLHRGLSIDEERPARGHHKTQKIYQKVVCAFI